MSSTIDEQVENARKRKHEASNGELSEKKKRKKQKTADNAVEENRPKKVKKQKESIDGSTAPTLTNGSSHTTGEVNSSTASIHKKKKSKRKVTDEQAEEQESALDGATAVASGQHEADSDIPDATEQEVHEIEATSHKPEDISSKQLSSDQETCFQTMRMSLYVPIPAISAHNQLAAIIASHLSPLLLSYFPPAGGVVLSYHDPVLSGRPEPGPSRPLLPPNDDKTSDSEEIYSKIGEELGASWIWLTATLLIFKPEPGNQLVGWTNAMSESFIGLVSYNYFQTSISRTRIPKAWSWSGPTTQQSRQRKQSRKGKLNDGQDTSQETMVESQDDPPDQDFEATDDSAGIFVDEDGSAVPKSLDYRVVDLEMIAAQDRGQRFALQLEGTLLNDEEESQIREEEREKWESRRVKPKVRSRAGTPLMSGGLAIHSRATSAAPTP